jgi:hypothetical protein
MTVDMTKTVYYLTDAEIAELKAIVDASGEVITPGQYATKDAVLAATKWLIDKFTDVKPN